MPRRSLFKRIALCLALGLITTITIAWIATARICNKMAIVGWNERVLVDGGIHRTFDGQACGWENRSASIVVFLADPTTIDQRAIPAWAQRSLASGRAPNAGLLLAGGWPMRCLWADITSPWIADSTDKPLLHRGAIQFWPANESLESSFGYLIQPAIALPYYPLWPGLLTNTAFFTVTWLTLLLVIPAARQARRRRRGLCPRCAYNLTALPPASPCPECGLHNQAATVTTTTNKL